MMRLGTLVLAIFISAFLLNAQPNNQDNISSDRYNIYVGGYLGLNGTINTAIGKGFVPLPGFTGPDIGASVLIPFAKRSAFGFMLDLGYSQNAYSMTYVDIDNSTIYEKYGYLAIQPSISLAGFFLGFGIDVPLSASAKDADGNKVSIVREEMVINNVHLPGAALSKDADFTGYLATKVDFRLGGNIHLLNDENGLLTLNIAASYNLTGLYKKASNYLFAYEKNQLIALPGQEVVYTYKNSLNSTPASLSIGVSYLFNLKF